MARMSSPRIDRVGVRAIRLPMREPHQTASGVITESPLVLTDVVCDDGTIGHSLVFAYTPMALQPTAELVRNLEPLVKGDPLAPTDTEQKLARRFRLLGPQGLVGMALAAIDMALWDAQARLLGVSLAQLLGGTAKPVPAYGAVGYDGEAKSARVAEGWARRGFTGVKAKIGYPSIAEDVAVIRAMRAAVGPDVAIMVDYNQSLTPEEAVQRMRVLDGEGLAWVEEPTLANDFAGHARVAREAATPIQAGENWWGPIELQHALDVHASDYVMPDVMKIGGVTGWLRATSVAATRGVRISNHLWPEVSAQLLSVTLNAHWLEYVDWWSDALREPLSIRAGMTDAGGVTGSGIEWNEAAIAPFVR